MSKDKGRQSKNQVTAHCSGILDRRISLKKAWAILKLTPRIFRFASRITPRHIVLLTVVRVLTSVIPVAQLWLGKMVRRTVENTLNDMLDVDATFPHSTKNHTQRRTAYPAP